MQSRGVKKAKTRVTQLVRMVGRNFATIKMKAIVANVKGAVKMLVKNLINVMTVNMIVNHHIKEDVNITVKILAKEILNVDHVKAVVKVAVKVDVKALAKLDVKVQRKLMLPLLCLLH